MSMQSFEGQYHDEKVLFKKHEHKAHVILRNIPKLFVFIFLGTLISVGIHFFLDNTLYTIVVTIIFLLSLSIYLYFIIKFYKETFFAFTNKRAVKSVRNGLFSSHLKELKIENIKQTTANSFGMLGKIFGYGNINVQGHDEQTSLYFKAIPKNKNIVMYISRMIDYVKKDGTDAELWEYSENYTKK